MTQSIPNLILPGEEPAEAQPAPEAQPAAATQARSRCRPAFSSRRAVTCSTVWATWAMS